MSLTTDVIRIDLPLSDLTARKNCTVKECYLELHTTFLSYKCIADYEELDSETGIWSTTITNYRWTKLRSRFVHVEMWRVKKEDGKYCVAIEFDGVSDRDGWYYDNPKKALVVYEQLRKYMLSEI